MNIGFLYVSKQNQKFCPYAVIYDSEKIRILVYCTQWYFSEAAISELLLDQTFS